MDYISFLGLAALVLSQRSPVPPPVQPVNLSINTPSDEQDPHSTADGLALYYSSNASSRFEFMMARGNQVQQRWARGGPASQMVSSETDDRGLYVMPLRRDQVQYVYYASRGDKENNNYDLYVAQRLDDTRAFTIPTPLNAVNSEADEMHPWMAEDGKALYFSRKAADGWRVLVSRRKSSTVAGGFGPPRTVDELPADFHHATLTPDGRTMYLQGRVGKDRWGIFRSELDRTTGQWRKPEAVSALNSDAQDAPKGEQSPALSRRGDFLYFVSDRRGGKGGLDVWVVPTRDLAGRPR